MKPSSILSKSAFVLLSILVLVIAINCKGLIMNTIKVNSSDDDTLVPSSEQKTLSAKEAYPQIKESSEEYTISFKNSSDFSSLINSNSVKDFYWSDKLSFNLIRLRDMVNPSIEEIANKSIENATTSWISGGIIDASSVYLYILCHSENYLSFVNVFEYQSRRVDYIHDYITIDINTGKRVMLNDLVEVTEEFVNHIQESNIAKDSKRNILSEGNHEIIQKIIKEIELEDLLKRLEECSFSQEQVIENGSYPIDESIGSLLFRNSFYLQNNRLIIVLQHGGELHVELHLDDIVGFLKVKKW